MRSPRRPKEPRSGRRKRSWLRILATCSLLFLLTPVLASTQSASPPLAEPSIKHGPEAPLILTEAELRAIIDEAIDDAVTRAVQAAVAEERSQLVAARIERDEYKRLWREAEAEKRRALLPWQVSTFAASVLSIIAGLWAFGPH